VSREPEEMSPLDLTPTTHKRWEEGEKRKEKRNEMKNREEMKIKK